MSLLPLLTVAARGVARVLGGDNNGAPCSRAPEGTVLEAERPCGVGACRTDGVC